MTGTIDTARDPRGAESGDGSPATGPGRGFPWLGLVTVLGAVFALYLPALGYPFLDLDDLYGVVENPGIRAFSLESAWFLFFEDTRDMRWFPLAYLSFAADSAAFGLDAAAFHRTNLVLHLANVALVFLLVWRLSGDALAAIVASALFGVHPLQVESVAWVSSRKNLLFFLFFLLSVLAYLRHASAREAGRSAPWAYGSSFALFCLAISAKTTAASLPAVLVLVDYLVARTRPRSPFAFLARSLPSKLVFLAPIAAAWWMTRRLAAQSPFLADYAFGTLDWLVITAHNFFLYLARAVVPHPLGVFHPLPSDAGPLPWHFPVYALLALALLGVGLAGYRRWPWLTFGLGWYFATILPMAVAPFFFSDMPLLAADRYFYQAAFGPFLLAGLGFAAAFRRLPSATARWALAGAALLLVAALSFVAARHRETFRGTLPLYEQAVRAHPSDAFAYRLALAQADAGHLGAAFESLEAAERAEHQVFFTRLFVHQWRIADLYRLKGDPARAADFLEAAIASTPNFIEPARTDTPLAWRYVAELRSRAGQPRRAAAARERASRAEPDPAYYFESHLFTTAPEEAREFLEARLAAAPHDAATWHALGLLHGLEARPEAARNAFERARALGFVAPPAEERSGL